MSNFAERLKLARRKARLSQRDLAEQAGVSAMSISKYENNEMMPSSDVLLKLAEALDVRMEFLLRSAPELEIRPVYRKHSRMGKKAQASVKAQIQDWLERYLMVESFFSEDEIDQFHQPEGFPFPVKSIESAEVAADRLREEWRLGNDPIDNLTELLEEKGIKVGLVEGDDNFDACTFLYDGEMPVIAVNESRTGDRQRFSLAHELGHILLEVAPGVDEEKSAHRFASAFLVPSDAARMELGQTRSSLDSHELLLLKQKYGMSMAAWIYRASDLGILHENDVRNLWRGFSSHGWRKNEPGEPLPTEQPGRMTRLVRRLLAEDVISRSRAAELLGISLGVYLKQHAEIYGRATEPVAHS
jgi:Zn-dependent peptidase ImmA (M78 family)